MGDAKTECKRNIANSSKRLSIKSQTMSEAGWDDTKREAELRRGRSKSNENCDKHTE